MGIGSNYMVESQEEEYRQNQYESIILEASYYVVNEKMSREKAFNHSKDLHEQREDKDNYVVVNEDSGEIEFLHSELKPPVIEETHQITAVAEELSNKFDVFDL